MSKLKVSIVEPPEFLVILKALLFGFLLSSAFQVGLSSGSGLYTYFQTFNSCLSVIFIMAVAFISITYLHTRGMFRNINLIVKSRRIDLFVFFLVGIIINLNLMPLVESIQTKIKLMDSFWPLMFIVTVITAMTSVIARKEDKPINIKGNAIYATDEEITDKNQDLLSINEHAKMFAESVVESGAVAGLVYGVDGPWGVGKSSFINLAQKYWDQYEELIVCRFEPLRYANESDLSEKLIKEVTAEIQKSVFAPEFKPVANRYTRLVKGKADISFFGFKISLQSNNETLDDLIADIDAVLKRVGRRLIIVIDDLDRLDHKTINNVLFSTRRTFKLSQATYILCYDTEVLVGEDFSVSGSREFLEKFVTIKTSLFVDSVSLRNFLKEGWQIDSEQMSFVPADTLDKLASLLDELSKILDSDKASKYLPLVGNLRKVKRIINALVLMKIETSSLNNTDFSKKDLLILVLLHLNYPGVFRQIYAEETGGRQGLFSLKRPSYDNDKFENHEGFDGYVEKQDEIATFLLQELFKAEKLELDTPSNIEEEVKSSRACFNYDKSRNLEKFLQLIVRYTKPEAQDTFILYKTAFENLKSGVSLSEILAEDDFQTESSHDKFWRLVTNRCFDLEREQVNWVLDYLVNTLVDYSSISSDDRPMRRRSIYSIVRILDIVSWRSKDSNRQNNSPENVEEIALRIFGEGEFEENGIIEKLTEKKRGVLGWYDLLLFRLTCCADRQGQVHEITKALIYNQDNKAENTGIVSILTILEMRKISQVITSRFIQEFVKPKINFYEQVSELDQASFKGKYSQTIDNECVAGQIERERTLLASFVMYQLVNPNEPNGTGVGCGFYDLEGKEDEQGIAKIINDYVFQFCFSPYVERNNVIFFLDHCLSHLSSSFFDYEDNDRFKPTKKGVLGGFSKPPLVKYWSIHKDLIKQIASEHNERKVFTHNYTAFYSEDLEDIYTVLDELENELKDDINQKVENPESDQSGP
jgi:hypothetical protein